MSKPNRVNYDGAALYINGYLTSRVQNVDASTDLGEEEARELTNPEVVEFTATNPQVTITVETNEYGSMRGLRAIAGVTGGVMGAPITIDSFEFTAADLGIVVEEDDVLARTALVNNASLTSIAWNFDAGGVATESYTFEADNFEWWRLGERQAFSLIGVNPIHNPLGSGTVVVGTNLANYTPAKVLIDGVEVTGTINKNTSANGNTIVWWIDTTAIATGTNYRVFVYKTSPSTSIEQKTSAGTSAIGSIPRGKINIYLVSGTSGSLEGELSALTATNFLRVQSVSIDADLSRDELVQLGNFRAYFRSLVRPVNVNLTFSTNASDLEEWAKLSDVDPAGATTRLDITSFVKNAALKIDIYDKQDTDNTRARLKTLVYSGLQVVGQTFSIDVGGIGVQDFTVRCSNFLASGRGILQHDPLSTSVPTD